MDAPLSIGREAILTHGRAGHDFARMRFRRMDAPIMIYDLARPSDALGRRAFLNVWKRFAAQGRAVSYFWRLNVEMQALLILAGGVTALGGSILLSALCRLFFSTPRPQPVEADRLLRREEAFKRYCENAQARLDEQRRELDVLTNRAVQAAQSLNAALESSFPRATRNRRVENTLAPAAPFEFREFSQERARGSRG